MTPPLIRMPNGNAVRADLILYVRATEDAVHVQTSDGNWCFDMDGDDELAIRHRDRIIAEVNAACGGAAEPTAVVQGGGV